MLPDKVKLKEFIITKPLLHEMLKGLKKKKKIKIMNIKKATQLSTTESKKKKNKLSEQPDQEEKEREIENLFEKIMKENFPDLVKEIDIQI